MFSHFSVGDWWVDPELGGVDGGGKSVTKMNVYQQTNGD